jgi:hypothetical protein
MQNEYDTLLEAAIARCELLAEGESRETCCAQPGRDCPAAQPSPPYVRHASDYGAAILVGCLLAAFGVLLLVRASRNRGRAWLIAAGWLLWWSGTLAFVVLMQPFGSSTRAEDLLPLVLWLLLPPTVASVAAVWLRALRSARGGL